MCFFSTFYSEYYPLRRSINLMVIHAWRESTDDSIQSLLKPFPFPISTSEEKWEKTPTWQHTRRHTHTHTRDGGGIGYDSNVMERLRAVLFQAGTFSVSFSVFPQKGIRCYYHSLMANPNMAVVATTPLL